MAPLKKQIYSLLIAGGLMLLGLLVFTSNIPPKTESAVPVFIVLLLLYLLSASFIALFFVLSTGTSIVRHATMTFLLACIPPAFIMLASLRQATAADLLILFLTIVVIVWYATYKK